MSKNKSGFTVVELLIVIIIIAILAMLTLISFSYVRSQGNEASIQSDLKGAASQMGIAQTRAGGVYPNSLPADVKTSNGTVLQLVATGSQTSYCINAYGKDNSVWSVSSGDSTPRNYLCSGVPLGSPVGGSLPAVPKNTNLVADLSNWALPTGATFNQNTSTLLFDKTKSFNVVSPLVKVDGAAYAKLVVDSYATVASPTGTPDSQVYFSASYYGADGTTLATSSAGYTSNGNAQALPLNTWKTFTWSTPTGPNVIYVKFVIISAPTSRTSDNQFRNVQIMAQ